MDSLDRPKEPPQTGVYQQQQQQHSNQRPQQPSHVVNANNANNAQRKPIVITRPGGGKVVPQPAINTADPYASKVTIVDSPSVTGPTGIAGPSPPVYPQYKAPVLPPSVTAYVNPTTGVVTTYETMVLDDRPDSAILEPPPITGSGSGTGIYIDDNEPGLEYRINKVLLLGKI